MDKVKIGIIGIGNMGTAHAKNVLAGKIEGMELAAICDTNPEKLKRLPEVKGFASSAEMIRSGEVNAVLVATPHYDHTTIGIDALEQGLHVLVEKPISVHKKDCERLIAAHKNKDQVFAAMFNQRPDPRYQELKKLITGGQLGEIRRVVWVITNWFRTCAYYASGDWRATWSGEGGGVLLNQCPHQIDLWQWLFGMPVKVRAFGKIGRYHDIEVEDDVTAYMEYADGMSGVFVTTTGEAPGSNRLEVHAEMGKVVIDPSAGSGLHFTRNTQETTKFSQETEQGFGRPSTWDVRIDTDGNGPQHVGILQNFANAILKGEELIAPAAEGIRSVELANAMIYSMLNDQTVDMPLNADDYEVFLKKLISESTFAKKSDEGGGASDSDFSKSF